MIYIYDLRKDSTELKPWTGDRVMNKSPCLACELVSEDKNKCLENCDKLKQYQELLLKQGIYAKI